MGSTLVLGFGAVGRATTATLLARGESVCVGQRHRPADLPDGARFKTCDVLDAASVRQAVEGAAQVVLAVGFKYDAAVWRAVWPRTMTNVIDACAVTGARLIFVDNLYLLGPQRAPLREDMALTTLGAKPPVLAEVTRIWQAARQRVRVAALRATDFYGPGVTVSHLGSSAFGALAQQKAAMLLAPPDTLHDFAYVPDIARAVVALLGAPDDAYGRVWNMSCAPTCTPREILQLGADALHIPLKLMAIPLRLIPALGLLVPFLWPTCASSGIGPTASMAASSRRTSALSSRRWTKALPRPRARSAHCNASRPDNAEV